MLKKLPATVKQIYEILEGMGYKPIIVGSVALILQGWLPNWFIDRTKDVDLYVDDPAIIYDEDVEKEILKRGLVIGRSEIGGIYIDSDTKPIEIVYPIYDFYIPKTLLWNVVYIDNMRILEGHSVLVAMSLGHDITKYAEVLEVEIDTRKLYQLLNAVRNEVDVESFTIAKKRIDEFIEHYSRRVGRHVFVR